MTAKRTLIFAMTAALLLAFTATGAVAYRGYGPGGCPGWGGEATELDADTQAKLQAQTDKFLEDTAYLRNDIRAKYAELAEVVNADVVDREKAVALQGEISALKAQMATARLDHRLAMKEIAPELEAGQGQGRGYGRRGGCDGAGGGAGGYGCWRR